MGIINDRIMYLKNEYDFWNPHAKNDKNPTYLFKKLRAPFSFLCFQYKNASLDQNDVIWVKSSNFNEIMKILTYFLFQMFITFDDLFDLRITIKIGGSDPGSSPLILEGMI